MDYRENPEEVAEFLDGLEEGERVYIEADVAEMNEDDPTRLFKRGDEILIDDQATVLETSDHGVTVELDKEWVKSAGDPEEWATNVFQLSGGDVFSKWKYVGDGESSGYRQPANVQIAMLNRIEKIED